MIIKVTDPELLELDRRHSAGNVRIADNTGWETDRSCDPCIHPGLDEGVWDIY